MPIQHLKTILMDYFSKLNKGEKTTKQKTHMYSQSKYYGLVQFPPGVMH